MTPRDKLLAEIRRDFADTANWTGRPEVSPRVFAALAAVAREAYVPPAEAPYAYINAPLPIGHRQTISQPYIVAIMTELLDLAGTESVLEIGTGSGYQAAILARLVPKVFTVEVIPELAEQARANLRSQGVANVEVRTGDGNDGWPEHAPYDAIIVTAAAAELPPALVAQLKPGGRMVIPLGRAGGAQDLVVVEKTATGALRRNTVLPVAFVPLVRA